MSRSSADSRLRCIDCGYEAPRGEAWTRVDHPPLGTLTQCPECGSTDVRDPAP